MPFWDMEFTACDFFFCLSALSVTLLVRNDDYFGLKCSDILNQVV